MQTEPNHSKLIQIKQQLNLSTDNYTQQINNNDNIESDVAVSK